MNIAELKTIAEKQMNKSPEQAFEDLLVIYLQLITNYEKAVEALKKIANEDFRGNRPQSAVDAYKTLKDLGEV